MDVENMAPEIKCERVCVWSLDLNSSWSPSAANAFHKWTKRNLAWPSSWMRSSLLTLTRPASEVWKRMSLSLAVANTRWPLSDSMEGLGNQKKSGMNIKFDQESCWDGSEHHFKHPLTGHLQHLCSFLCGLHPSALLVAPLKRWKVWGTATRAVMSLPSKDRGAAPAVQTA